MPILPSRRPRPGNCCRHSLAVTSMPSRGCAPSCRTSHASCSPMRSSCSRASTAFTTDARLPCELASAPAPPRHRRRVPAGRDLCVVARTPTSTARFATRPIRASDLRRPRNSATIRDVESLPSHKAAPTANLAANDAYLKAQASGQRGALIDPANLWRQPGKVCGVPSLRLRTRRADRSRSAACGRISRGHDMCR